MRHARTAGMLLTVLLFVRCGVPWLPSPAPVPETPVAVRAFAPAPVPVALAPTPASDEDAPRPISHQERIRKLVASLDSGGCASPAHHRIKKESLSELLPLGAAAYPIYEAIFADPNSMVGEILGMYELLNHLGEDRRRFAPFVAQRLGAPDELMPRVPERNGGDRHSVRTFLILMLADIGDERHAWALLPAMYDDNDENLQFHAVKTIVKIGGKPELDALTAWLTGQNPNLPMVRRMWKLRDELDARIKARVRELVGRLGTPGCGNNAIIDGEPYEPHQVKELKKLGETAFAMYETILADPNSRWEEIAGTSFALAYAPTERRHRFASFAVQRLTAADAMMPLELDPIDGTPEFKVQRLESSRTLVRQHAIYILEGIGNKRDAWAILPFICGDNHGLRRDAAEALAKIGGQRELDALTDWLAFQNRNDPQIAKIKKLRDEFEARLRAHPPQRTF